MTMMRMKPTIPEGPYPQARLWPHVGMTPSKTRMRIMIRIVPKDMGSAPDAPLRPRSGTTSVIRWAALLSSEPLTEEEVELLPHRGKRSNERSSASLRYAAWERTRKPVRLLSKTADVDEAYAFESGTLLQATQHGHNLALQLRSWERDPRGQLYSFSSGHRVATANRGIWFPTASTAWTRLLRRSIAP